MLLEGAQWAWNRFHPREGWLSLALLFLIVVVLILAVLEVEWVPEDPVIIPATLIGLLMGVVLAKRPTPSWISWLLITAYGLLIVTLTLGSLWPPLNLLFSDWPALRLYWLENGELFLERTSSWVTAISVGGRSNETIIFAILMGLSAWFLAAYLGWSAYRRRQPLFGLTLMGLLLAVNGYYGAAQIEWAAMFVGLAVLTTAVFRFAQLEWSWENRSVDYSSQIRLELIVYAAGIGSALLALAFLLPTFRVNRVASFFLGNENVAALEEALDRAFGGVDVPRERPIPPGRPGGSGILPRAFLVGNAPELEKILMMTATAELVEGPLGASVEDATHWRALSYEVYTGRGWALSQERAEEIPPFEPLPLAAEASQMRIRQNVHWRYDNRSARYTLGYPLQLDHPVTAYWRDRTDLVRVTARQQNQYEVLSLFPAATAEELRAATLDEIHPAIKRRYLRLPDTLPQRVRDLAFEVAGQQPTPYDQALALERFLRQYEYSLEVPFPPEDSDVVDFFLFDLQQGYCDYYASAMVVMARSLGLPARLASGFMAQEADEEGVQTIRQINSHAWAEVYFEGYGWIEFEPTTAFASPHAPRLEQEASQPVPYLPEKEPEPPPIPEREAEPEPLPWAWIAAGLALAAVLGFLLWRRQSKRHSGIDALQNAYGNLQYQAYKLGQEIQPGQTPYEFNDQLQAQLGRYDGRSRLAGEAETIREPARELTALFVEHQYSKEPPDRSHRAQKLWQHIRRPLWLLRLAAIFGLPDQTKKKGQ
jgi:transglutaminase-like putative cysteine protease